MSITINTQAYVKLIDEDIEWLEKNRMDSPERWHIIQILKKERGKALEKFCNDTKLNTTFQVKGQR
jgi:hypothetical protein